MGFFSKILEKLGIKKNEPAAEPVQVAAPAKPAAPVKQAPPAAAKPATVASVARPAGMKAEKNDLDSLKTIEPVKAPVPVAISEVDVVKQLEELSVGKGLN